MYSDENDDLYILQCFEVEEKLGSGSFGNVFKVKSKENGCYYAVKIAREPFRGPSDRQRKLQEVAKHETLPPHSNLIKFYKAWEEKQILYIQTELCDRSVAEKLRNQSFFPEPIVWNYLVDLLMAIDHLHARNLVHLDIKPENIFVSKGDILKLGDFSLILDLSRVRTRSMLRWWH